MNIECTIMYTYKRNEVIMIHCTIMYIGGLNSPVGMLSSPNQPQYLYFIQVSPF